MCCRVLMYVSSSTPCVFNVNTTLTHMTHFFKSVRGYGDPQQHYLAHAFRSLLTARAGMIFMGDSTLRVSNKYSKKGSDRHVYMH